MKCLRCDSPVSETARFCENCGVVLRGGDREQRLVRAHLQELDGHIDAAVEEYEKLVRDDGDAVSVTVRKHLGNLHFRLGHLRRAREHLAGACRAHPDNAALWHDLGVVQYHMADLEGAVDSFLVALKRDPGLLLANFWLAQALYHRGDHSGAAEAFRKLLQRYPNFTIARFHLGVIYARQGLKEQAQEEFNRVLLENPDDAPARFYTSA